MTTVYEAIIHLLQTHAVPYREFLHAPLYSYEEAERERRIHGWEGTESKSVFLTDKRGGYYIYATLAGKRVDFARMREIAGVKLSLASEGGGVLCRDVRPRECPAFRAPDTRSRHLCRSRDFHGRSLSLLPVSPRPHYRGRGFGA